MYVPPLFAEEDAETVAAMIDAARLGLLVTHGRQGLTATHLPFIHDRAGGRLVGHIARANPQWRDGAAEALVVLGGPEAYVSPNWYPSKAVDGKQVPTWNYEAVHVTGAVEWFDDRDRLLDIVARLSDRHEAGREQPWSIGDAPAEYIERLLGGIVGVEVAIGRIEAKRKLSQNKPPADRRGVVEGLSASADARDRLVADRMRSREEC